MFATFLRLWATLMQVLRVWRNTSVAAAVLWVHLNALWISTAAADEWRIGFAKLDVTPTEPIRLSGYASRDRVSEGIADPLSVRVMVLSPAKPPTTTQTAADREASQKLVNRTCVLVSVDGILVTSRMTVEIARWLLEQHGIPRSQLVLSSSHTHAGPHIEFGLDNLFRTPSTPQQQQVIRSYTERLASQIRAAIQLALQQREPATVSIGESSADFAINRRVIRDGQWSGFGEQTTGPVDRRLRVLVARAPSGQLIGGAFMYACHCTTLGGQFYQVSGDWAGLAASRLEVLHPDAVFLPVIGCGADANPNPRGSYDLAQSHAAEIVDGVQHIVQTPDETQPLEKFPVANFGYAGLAPEHPTPEFLEQQLTAERPNDRRWAEHMRGARQQMGRLPETYPMPIHTWQFGSDLTWVFLGGEVVVDYQLQLEKELATQQTWVAAYCDDVFAYVASEAMRSEGGYEVDSSMIYYLQPGRWQTGTQSLIIRRVTEVAGGRLADARPLSAAEGLASMQVPDGFRIELVASEPLVQDPINVAFGADGRVWVVEMADYPRGSPGGGRVKWLRDRDGDGRLDESQVFLDGLSYPTSVFPWRDGALVIAAPNVIFAADRDGDGVAEVRENWLTGIGEANPQHRASGFEIGLDGWLHFGAGDDTEQLISVRTGRKTDVRHRDVAWHPTSDTVIATSGSTQFVRARDAFGNWFGNSNSRPIYQYVIEDRYLKEQSVRGGVRRDLLSPAIAPPVLPRNQIVDRFNDLFALNRFTSACSSTVARVPGMSPSDREQAEGIQWGFVCEPVHNLVSRIEMRPQHTTWTARRHPEDQQLEFLTSSDTWSRPVRIVNAPDGSLWVVDMVRKVIEHPEWIPTAWQQRLDLRDGSNLGRIYRVVRDGFRPTPLPNWQEKTDVLAGLASDNGSVRDLALEQILNRRLPLETEVRQLAREHGSPAVRASALGCLSARDWLTQRDIQSALADRDPRLVRFALELTERFARLNSLTEQALQGVVERKLGPAIDLQWVLSASRMDHIDATAGLRAIARRCQGDEWIGKALSLVRQPDQAQAVAEGMLEMWTNEQAVSGSDFAAATASLRQLWKRIPPDGQQRLMTPRLETMASREQPSFSPGDLLLLRLLEPQQEAFGELEMQVIQQARRRLLDSTASEAERLVLINMLGSGFVEPQSELEDIRHLLQAEPSPRLRRGVLEAARQVNSTDLGKLLIDLWPELSLAEHNLAAATLLTRGPWTELLTTALEAGKIEPEDLDQATIQRLRSHHDRSIRARCMTVLGKPTPRSQVVASFLSDMPTPASSAAGKQLFEQHCAACHAAKTTAEAIGPPLGNLKHWTLDQWVTAIMDPNQAVESKYRQIRVLTVDGQVLAGIAQDPRAQRVRLAQSDGSWRELEQSDIESVTETTQSLMPEGLEEKLTPEQLSTVIGFLREQ